MILLKLELRLAIGRLVVEAWLLPIRFMGRGAIDRQRDYMGMSLRERALAAVTDTQDLYLGIHLVKVTQQRFPFWIREETVKSILNQLPHRVSYSSTLQGDRT
jgi:hypothetical protein